ncbi:helix-turn-helix domain-containing protein [Streptomyces sp. SBT349]|uniref:helix-turn-helix domain-containing protein n=1 Tax=Streptomyces sp. SBT349 TaxID=1580539 RepID=UPI00066EDF94|nr:helix-turn-helix transcriptional regulator [Streptomyces sp. SBT349]
MPSTDPPSARVLAGRREIGSRIRAAMLHAGMSQERLAERAGLSRHTVYRVQLGTISTRLDWLIAIADAVGVDLAELVREEEPGPPSGG